MISFLQPGPENQILQKVRIRRRFQQKQERRGLNGLTGEGQARLVELDAVHKIEMPLERDESIVTYDPVRQLKKSL